MIDMIEAHIVRDMIVVESHKNGVATLCVTGPASQKNRGAHAVQRIAREALAKSLGFSPAKLSQKYEFIGDGYVFTARYSTAL